MADYMDILKDWERSTANPVIYENIDLLFPSFCFQRLQAGSDKDRWASSMKMDLTSPKTPNREKTVVRLSDFKFREQGEWDNSISVIDKLMEDYSFSSVYDVYRYIAGRFNLEMPTTYGSGVSDKSAVSRRESLLQGLADYFSWNLMNNSSARSRATWDYLLGRGFTADSIKELGFGFVPSWEKVESFITSPRMRFTKEELDSYCRVRSDEDGYTSVGIKHVLAIPYRCAGELKGFLFRTIDGDAQPKYKANTGLERKVSFFNMASDRSPKEIIVVEGEIDALTARAAGIQNVVAIGGSDISGDRRLQVFDALCRNTTKITLCLDLDEDSEGKVNGMKRFQANKRSIHTILDVSPDFNEIYVASFPKATDPDRYIRENGAQAFCSIIGKAVPWWEYLYRNLSKK